MAKTARAKVSVDELIRSALLKAAETEVVKLTDKVDGLFASATGANKDAIGACKSAEKPLLTVVGKEGKAELVALAPAGFERVAADIPEEKVGAVAKRVALAVPAAERVAFIQDALRRTPLAAPELTPLLEEAIAAEKAAHEARIAAAAKRRAAEEAAKAALERAAQLIAERQRNRLDALRREWEAEGASADDRPERAAQPQVGAQPAATTLLSKPNGPDEVGFFRQVARRLVSSWLEAVRLGKPDARRFLEVAMGNLDVLEPLGAEGQATDFNGAYHKAETGISTGTRVTVVRPGWRLIEDDGEYVIEQALVKP